MSRHLSGRKTAADPRRASHCRPPWRGSPAGRLFPFKPHTGKFIIYRFTFFNWTLTFYKHLQVCYPFWMLWIFYLRLTLPWIELRVISRQLKENKRLNLWRCVLSCHHTPESIWREATWSPTESRNERAAPRQECPLMTSDSPSRLSGLQ